MVVVNCGLRCWCVDMATSTISLMVKCPKPTCVEPRSGGMILLMLEMILQAAQTGLVTWQHWGWEEEIKSNFGLVNGVVQWYFPSCFLRSFMRLNSNLPLLLIWGISLLEIGHGIGNYFKGAALLTVRRLMNMCILQDNRLSNEREDRWVWIVDNKQMFSVKSCYRWLSSFSAGTLSVMTVR